MSYKSKRLLMLINQLIVLRIKEVDHAKTHPIRGPIPSVVERRERVSEQIEELLDEAYYPSDKSDELSERESVVKEVLVSAGETEEDAERMAREGVAAAQRELKVESRCPLTVKDHEIALFVNELRDVAEKYGQTQQLRARIVHVIAPFLEKLQESEWQPRPPLTRDQMEKSKPPYTTLRAGEVVQLSKSEARKLLAEVKPQITGCVVGEFPTVEKLAHSLQVELGLVS